MLPMPPGSIRRSLSAGKTARWRLPGPAAPSSFTSNTCMFLRDSIHSNLGPLMHPMFSVTSEEIQSLTDVQARELVAQLCKCELRVKGISTAAVSWGGDQRAKDGGVDVRVEVSPPLGIGGYVKKDRCAFQVKAENFGASKIPGEMAPKGALRQAITDLAASGGAYAIASTRDNLSDSSLADRKAAMERCLSSFSWRAKSRSISSIVAVLQIGSSSIQRWQSG